MPSEPVSSIIGIGLLGMGTLTLYSAYKGVSPLEWLREVIATGKFIPPDKLAPAFAGAGADIATIAVLDAQIVAEIDKKNPDLSKRFQDALNNYVSDRNSTTQAALQKVIAEAKAKGFNKSSSAVSNWLKSNPPTQGSSSTGNGTVVPA